MQEFLLLFRRSDDATPLSPEQLQKITKPWQDWIGGIAAKNMLAGIGNRLDSIGRVVKPGNVVVNGPFVEMKETVGGYTLIKAYTLDDAIDVAKGCPILTVGGSVEVRPVVAMEQNQ